MKLIILSLTIIFLMTGCRDTSSKNTPYLLGSNNKNSLADRTKDKAQDRKNRLEINKVNNQTKIEIAKIKSGNSLLVAKVNAQTHKEIAKTDAEAKITITQIDATTKKEDTQIFFYISMAIIIVIIIALYLLHINNKHNRELKAKINQDRLKQELALKERELHEQRLHKMLDLVADGKLSPQMEEEIILSISNQKSKTIESKK